jgi:hypothetical protein
MEGIRRYRKVKFFWENSEGWDQEMEIMCQQNLCGYQVTGLRGVGILLRDARVSVGPGEMGRMADTGGYGQLTAVGKSFGRDVTSPLLWRLLAFVPFWSKNSYA